AERAHLGDLRGDAFERAGIDAEPGVAHQGFAGQLEQDSLEPGRHYWSRVSHASLRTAARSANELYYRPACLATSAAKSSFFFSRPSPSSQRTKRRIFTFSPILEMSSVRSAPMVFLPSVSRTHTWSSRQMSFFHLASCPSTTLGIIASGI